MNEISTWIDSLSSFPSKKNSLFILVEQHKFPGYHVSVE